MATIRRPRAARLRGSLGALLLLAASTAAVSAHHSIAAVYDATNVVTLDATVTSFHFVNPHPFVVVEAADPAGGTPRGGARDAQPWHLEMDNLGELRDAGMTRDSIRFGDRVIVTASRSRTGEHRAYVRKLVRPADGFEYEQVGFSPRIRTR